MEEHTMHGTIEDKIKEKIFHLLTHADRPLSTQDIALDLDLPWHSVQTRCLRLQLENRIKGFRIGRINLWEINVK